MAFNLRPANIGGTSQKRQESCSLTAWSVLVGMGTGRWGPSSEVERWDALQSTGTGSKLLDFVEIRPLPFNLRALAASCWALQQASHLLGTNGLCSKHPHVETKDQTLNKSAGQGASKILSNRADTLAEIGAHNGHQVLDNAAASPVSNGALNRLPCPARRRLAACPPLSSSAGACFPSF